MSEIDQSSLDTIIATLRELTPAIKAEGVTRLALFGSRARGDARPDSDLDVLINLEPDAELSLLDVIGVQHIIEDATGLSTQATVGDAIKPRFAERIADDLIEIF